MDINGSRTCSLEGYNDHGTNCIQISTVSRSWTDLVHKCVPVAEMQNTPNEIANYVSSCKASHLIAHVLERSRP